MLRGILSERLVALFLMAWVVLNFPLLAIWDQSLTVWGLPLFPLGLFSVWIALIGVLAWLLEGHESG